ncbi:hypothetical protein NQ317_019389 [Molorchus minor]|uniref:Large ribosomal subunit protein mL64 n=1 Tax=Molorchus minor TaxID=1323400 RepID=A0ABQ9JDZ4_9CUCU|nr:hypothetical protein NQ317_019389 [Molorchus minor]
MSKINISAHTPSSSRSYVYVLWTGLLCLAIIKLYHDSERVYKKSLFLLIPVYFFVRRSSQLDVEKLEKDSTEVQVVDEDAKFKEEEIQQKRNKSRLHDKHRDFLHEINPYPEPMSWHHGTIKYVRRAYGRYGQSSGVDPSICWPVKEELNDALAYEQIKYSYTIPEIVAQAKQKEKGKRRKHKDWQNDIIKKNGKLRDVETGFL